ncbi:hypothetical protein C4588_03280 [Candidatus Parcubacteria bacterium]|nr:MAG: hypothetical protein C4588_03280 [Candidatus Parcubacteria bacterium]
MKSKIFDIGNRMSSKIPDQYNFNWGGSIDAVSRNNLPAANYETAHQNLRVINGVPTLVNYTANEYVRDSDGDIITCGAWKELCLRSTNPLLWTKSGALNIAAAAEYNTGAFTKAARITDNGAIWNGYHFWLSSTSGAPTGKQFVTVYYIGGTSGGIRVAFGNPIAPATTSVYSGNIGSAVIIGNTATTILTKISDDIVFGAVRKAEFIMQWDPARYADSLYISIGPNSTTGKSIIVLGASVAGAVGTGDITTERPFTETTGSVATLSSLSADLVNGRGPRVTYASAPKLLTALQGASTNAQGQIEWTGTPSGLPASDNQILACNTTQGLLVMKSDGSAQVNGQRYSATLASAFAANTESKIIIPYEPGEMKLIHGANETVTDFSGTFGPGTVFGIGPGTSHMTHKSLKIFKRPRVTLDGMTTVYSGTVSGMLISAVAGTAFFDNLPAEILALADGNHLIEVTDATGKKIVAVMAAVGSGETLGSNLSPLSCCTDPDNDVNVTTGWSPGQSAALSSVAGGATGNALQIAENGLVNPVATDVLTVVAGKLYMLSGKVLQGTEATYRYIVQNKTASYSTIVDSGDKESSGSWTSFSATFTIPVGCTEAQVVLRNVALALSSRTVLFDDISFKQVLTPSTSGVTLVSYLGSTTQSLMYADPAFAYNQAAAYTVTVKEMV